MSVFTVSSFALVASCCCASRSLWCQLLHRCSGVVPLHKCLYNVIVLHWWGQLFGALHAGVCGIICCGGTTCCCAACRCLRHHLHWGPAAQVSVWWCPYHWRSPWFPQSALTSWCGHTFPVYVDLSVRLFLHQGFVQTLSSKLLSLLQQNFVIGWSTGVAISKVKVVCFGSSENICPTNFLTCWIFLCDQAFLYMLVHN